VLKILENLVYPSLGKHEENIVTLWKIENKGSMAELKDEYLNSRAGKPRGFLGK